MDQEKLGFLFSLVKHFFYALDLENMTVYVDWSDQQFAGSLEKSLQLE